MDKKTVILLIKTASIITAVVGVVLILKKDLGAALCIIFGTVAFYSADKQ